MTFRCCARLHQPLGYLSKPQAMRQTIGTDTVIVARRWVGPSIEQDADDLGRAAPVYRVYQWKAVWAGLIRVAAVSEQQAHRLRSFDIQRAKQSVGAGDTRPRIQEEGHQRTIGHLGSVIERLVIVRIGAGLEQFSRDDHI